MSTVNVKMDSQKVVHNVGCSIMQFEQNFPLEEFAAGNYKQHPAVTLLTCSDARMPADIFGPLFNNIFCVENIGNQFKTSTGSVLYGLFHLHTPLMIVAGHSDCGAIKAAHSNFIDEPAAIRSELSTVKNSLEDITNIAELTLSQSQDESSALAELNVDMQINYILADHKIAQLVENNSLLVLGVFADLHNVHQEGYGKIYTVNINGEHNKEVLKSYVNFGIWADQTRRLVNY